MIHRLAEHGRKLASSGVLFRVGDGKVMRVAAGLMDARARLRAVAELASEAWEVLLNGQALPTLDPALEADPEDAARGANGKANGHANGHSNGHANGHSNGHANGHSNGHVNGYANGHANGHTNGHSNGHANGHSNGHTNGHSNGHAALSGLGGLRDGALGGLGGLAMSGASAISVVTDPGARRPTPASNGEARSLSEEIASRTSLAKLSGPDVLEKCYRFTTADTARKMGVYPYFRAFDFNNGPEAQFEGRTITMLGSNNYLGLTTHPKVREAARAAIEKYGTSMTGSRLVNGTMKLHKELEERLAALHGKEAGLVFTTGYQVNLAVISALLSNKKTVAVADKDVHASIYDGVRLAQANGARLVRFKHNDPDSLEQALNRLDADEGALVITEGVFSAQGEIGRLQEVVRIAKERGARVFVDDAHGAGVLGPGGRGTPAHLGVSDQIDLIGGTFSKSFASIGGWLVGDRKVLDYIQHFAHAFLFAASAAPPCVAAAIAALDVMQEEPWRQEKLRENFTYMRTELKRLGFDVGKTETAIIPIFVRDDLKAMMMGKVLLDEFGIYANVFITPGVPPKHQALRTSYMATHERRHLDRALEAFEKVGKRFGVI